MVGRALEDVSAFIGVVGVQRAHEGEGGEAVGEAQLVQLGDGTVQVHVQGTDRLVPSIVNAAENANLDVIDLAVAEPSLETVFINLTGKELRE